MFEETNERDLPHAKLRLIYGKHATVGEKITWSNNPLHPKAFALHKPLDVSLMYPFQCKLFTGLAKRAGERQDH
jgi:hypothetical protein